ncbi:hypothetical protein P6F26_14490, partial [Roseibacterium sp. SDUM158017]|nr:hypothetical protein [Roseibacterium sp. SDUM158017]
GFVSFPNGDTKPIASASYSVPTPRGELAVSLQQTTAVNSADESILRTSVAVDYDQAVNALSSWSLNGSLLNVDVLGNSAEDQARAQIGVSYNHALTRDWDLSASLRHRITYQDGTENNRASTLSLSLERSFSFRP